MTRSDIIEAMARAVDELVRERPAVPEMKIACFAVQDLKVRLGLHEPATVNPPHVHWFAGLQIVEDARLPLGFLGISHGGRITKLFDLRTDAERASPHAVDASADPLPR